MAQVAILPLLLSLAFFSQTIKDIERAFFQNDARLLHPLLTSQQRLYISLPEPLSFSDHVSADQAYFLFRRIFSTYTTFEFFIDKESIPLTRGKSSIFKSRWSFKNNRNNDQYVFLIFFYLTADSHPPGLNWRIAELKAQKLL